MAAAGWLAWVPLPGMAQGADGPPGVVTVGAAASLTDAMREIAVRFETAHPGTKVQLVFGASGALAQQLGRGAPLDVLASADEATLALAVSRGWVAADSVTRFATNALVLAVPARPAGASGVTVTDLADLAKPAVRRVALGLPGSVPAGRYARAALEVAGLWRAVEPKAVGAASVRQVLDYLARAEVDAGFVYASDLATAQARGLREVLRVPTAEPVRYPAGVALTSPRPALARTFVAFLRQPPAQAVLAAHGFVVDPRP